LQVAFEYPHLSITDAVAAIMKTGGSGGPDGLYAFATTNGTERASWRHVHRKVETREAKKLFFFFSLGVGSALTLLFPIRWRFWNL
jgi:hypothetical protein